ncbi:MAG: hypothetical protein GY874_18345 [Desulfobacteraceae bacterium]|nr:hypothetical protein [Desulfobacteraceae bacterium]
MMRCVIKIVPILFAVGFISFCLNFPGDAFSETLDKVWKIAVFRTKPPHAVNIEQGLKKSLIGLGYAEGKNIVYLPTKIVGPRVEDFSETALQIRQILTHHPDIIVTIGTQASVPAWRIVEATGIPMVFAGVSYPVEGGLIKAFNQPTGKNITGISYGISAKQRTEVIRELFPDTKKFKKMAFIYSGQVLQDLGYMKHLKKLGHHAHWEFIFIDYYDHAQNDPSYKLLIKGLKKTDPDLAFGWYSLDDLGADAINFNKLLAEFNKPIVAITSEQIGRGAICGIITDHYSLGFVQASMIHRIINGENVGDIPPQAPTKYFIELNLKAAQDFGIVFDPDLIAKAHRIIR